MGIIVVSLGGSILFDSKGRFDYDFAGRIALALVRGFQSKGGRLIVLTGGGKRAREYANLAREKTGNEFFADRQAIKATRENAGELIKLLGGSAYGRVLESFDEADVALREGKIGVGGGMLEGLTTDAVAVLFAEKLGAKAVVNLGDTEGIYSADPRKSKSARRIGKMSHEELVKLAVANDSRKAGTHFVFDMVASKLAARGNIELRFANGRDLDQAMAAISGGKFVGTIVRN